MQIKLVELVKLNGKVVKCVFNGYVQVERGYKLKKVENLENQSSS